MFYVSYRCFTNRGFIHEKVTRYGVFRVVASWAVEPQYFIYQSSVNRLLKITDVDKNVVVTSNGEFITDGLAVAGKV